MFYFLSIINEFIIKNIATNVDKIANIILFI